MRVQIVMGQRVVLASGMDIIVAFINGVELNMPADERIHKLIASLEDGGEPHWKSPDGELGVIIPTLGESGQAGGVRVKLNGLKRRQLINQLKVALYDRSKLLH